MRQENSEIITDFKTGAGDISKNKDYFSFVENDDYACWVMADSLDSADDKFSARMAAESFFKEFLDNPTLKKRKLKKYIRQASKFLIEESRMVTLKSTFLVVVTDYKHFRWANVGNTRLYHFRKGRLKNKSTDHSLAQMMVEVGDLEPKKLNQHEERNNVTEFIGKKKRVKPQFSKKIELKEEDTLLLVTRGFWEQIMDDEIRPLLSETEENPELVEELEKLILEKDEKLNNYTIASIFVEKPYENTAKKKRFPKKAVLISLLLVGVVAGIFFGYRHLRSTQLARTEISEAEDLVASGDELVYLGDREEKERAVEKYEEAKEVFAETGSILQRDEVEEKMDNLEEALQKLEEAEEKKEEADSKFMSGEYEAALEGYEEALEDIEDVSPIYRSNEMEVVEEKIDLTEEINYALEMEEEAEIFYNSGEFSVAREKYNLAYDIYKTNELEDELDRVEDKIDQIEEDQVIERAVDKEETAENLVQANNFEDALREYEAVKSIYDEIGDNSRIEEIEKRMSEIQQNMGLREARNFETRGDEKAADQEFEAAIGEYERAAEIFAQLEKDSEVRIMENNIDNIRTNMARIEAEEYETRGNEKYEEGQYEEALSHFKNSLEIYREINSSGGIRRINNLIEETKFTLEFEEAETYVFQAQEKLQESNYSEAIDQYKKAVQEFQELNEVEKVEEMENRIEQVKREQKYSRAEKNVTTGENYFAEQQFEKAIEEYKKAEEIYLDLGDNEKIEMIENKIDNVYRKEKLLEAEEYKDIAETRLAEKEFTEAEKMFNQAEEIYQVVGEDEKADMMEQKSQETRHEAKLNQAEIFKMEADGLFETSSFNQAVEEYKKAVEIYRELENEIEKNVGKTIEEIERQKELGTAYHLEKRGDEYVQEEEFALAIEKYEAASEIFKNLEEDNKISEIENKIKDTELKKISPEIYN